MKKYTAIYKTDCGHFSMVQTDYTSKKDFAHDLRANGFKVTAILTDAEIERIKTGCRFDLNYSDITIEFTRECL